MRTLYNSVASAVVQARARGYSSTLEAALHGDNIPTSVVENLTTTRASRRSVAITGCVEEALACPPIRYDFSIPLVTFDKKYPYEMLDGL